LRCLLFWIGALSAFHLARASCFVVTTIKLTHSLTATPVAKPPTSTTSQCSILQDCKAQNGQCVQECDESKADCIPELGQEVSVFETSKEERVCEIPRRLRRPRVHGPRWKIRSGLAMR
jgi:hypothetical protein